MIAPDTFSGRLRSLRVAAQDLSASELDELAGLRRGHVSAIELGRRANVEVRTANKLAAVLGVSMDWLINGVGLEPDAGSVQDAVRHARNSHRPSQPGTGAADSQALPAVTVDVDPSNSDAA